MYYNNFNFPKRRYKAAIFDMERQTIAANFWVAPSKVRRNGLAPINVTITRNGKRASFSTGRMIRPENWTCYWGNIRVNNLGRTTRILPKNILILIRYSEMIEKHLIVILCSRVGVKKNTSNSIIDCIYFVE